MDVHERLRRHPELVPVLEKLADETGKIREEARTLDEMEGRLVAMQRRLMPEVMKVLVEARGREAESAVESRANSKRYRKKLRMQASLGLIEVVEQTYWDRRRGRELRPVGKQDRSTAISMPKRPDSTQKHAHPSRIMKSARLGLQVRQAAGPSLGENLLAFDFRANMS